MRFSSAVCELPRYSDTATQACSDCRAWRVRVRSCRPEPRWPGLTPGRRTRGPRDFVNDSGRLGLTRPRREPEASPVRPPGYSRPVVVGKLSHAKCADASTPPFGPFRGFRKTPLSLKTTATRTSAMILTRCVWRIRLRRVVELTDTRKAMFGWRLPSGGAVPVAEGRGAAKD